MNQPNSGTVTGWVICPVCQHAHDFMGPWACGEAE